ncbi:MAG: hypothetical protein CMP36_00660 [Rickettsiales bacterium]|nr:hypothetical protein [Rickettsiales bacterium]OUV83161.1 MAG: hypothetical protein CBC91_01040 [Rickettsiales bacterium TMED131]
MFKKKKSYVFHLDEEKDEEVYALTKYCEWRNCNKKGEFKAPTSRDKLRVFKWFCLEHIKIYNKGWDYFKGQTMDEIYNEVSSDCTWHRPTWIRVKKNAFNDTLNIFERHPNQFNKKSSFSLSEKQGNKIEEALKIMNLSIPFTIFDLKKQYKKMAKILHPDINKNNNEEYIINLNNAYTELLKFIK